MAEEKKTFEGAMERLEQIVHLLENGEAPLDQSLSYFAEGVELVKYCGSELDRAEQKIRMLVKNGEESYDERPFTDNKG